MSALARRCRGSIPAAVIAAPRPARWLLLATSLLVVFATADRMVFADTVILSPVKDNTLYEPIQTNGFADMSDGIGPTMFAGRVSTARNQAGQVAVHRAVIEFDVAGSIPAGSTISSVQLTLFCDKVKLTTAFNVSLHRSLAEWGEGTSNTGNSQQGQGEVATTNDATWRHTFYASQFWSIAGGDYVSTASVTRTVGATGSYTWGSTTGMVSDVQLWLDTPSQNHGWEIIGTETQTQTSKRFATRENGTVNNRPRLVVTYAAPTITGACCDGTTCSVTTAAACVAPRVYQGNGTTCASNPCVVVTGACCANSGTCTEVSQSSCTSSGGSHAGNGTTCAETECPVVLAPFVDALPIPVIAAPVSGTGGGTATYTLSIEESQAQLHRDLPATTVWGFDDGTHGAGFLGPTIEARSDQPVTVNWTNDLRVFGTGVLRSSHYLPVDTACMPEATNDAKTVMHLHGAHVPAAVDGYPENTFLPGDPPATYVYPNHQQAGSLWYHDHSMQVTRLNVYMGLAGLYFVRDAVEDALNLPSGSNEIPLLLQDRMFNPDGSFHYHDMWEDHFFGDKILVNGRVWPYLDVTRGKYRYRVVNGSNSRVYTLSLVPPTGTMSFTVIGTELGLLAAPVNGVSTLTIGPGERYDVVVDFAGRSAGEEILLENSAGAPFPNGPLDVSNVMKFRVTAAAGDTDPLPATLRTVTHLDPDQAARTRDLRLTGTMDDGCGRQMWMINELMWDDITEYPELGTTEIWRFINDSGVSHPMHLHLVGFQILDRQAFAIGSSGEIVPVGNPAPPQPEENGWKDTALVAPGQILRVIARFEDFKGKYAYHCHILEHEDHDMMRQFQTVSCRDGEIDPSEECDGGATGEDGCSASCELTEFVDLRGAAAGGTVSVTIEGVAVSVTTSAGQTPAQIAQALANAINSNTTLGLAVVAVASGTRVITTGHISAVSISDGGLQDVLTLLVSKGRLVWSTVGSASSYDIVRGSLSALHATQGDFTNPVTTEACLADNVSTVRWNDAQSPASGAGLWYLGRSQPGGSWNSGVPSQVGNRDAEIAASGHGCP